MSTNKNNLPDPNEVPFHGIKWITETDNDYVGRCPFCGDSIKDPTHAHLYVSKRYPIYHCYRCGAKGFLKDIERILNESCKKEYVLSVKYNIQRLDIPEILHETQELIKMYSLFITDQEVEYFRHRTKLKTVTYSNIKKFSLFPDYYARSFLYESIFKKITTDVYRTWTIRGFGTGISGRAHSSTNDRILRYINGNIDMPWNEYVATDTYFIRSYPLLQYGKCIPNTLVIAEGIYDIVPLYINRDKYSLDDRDSIFMAAHCSSYDRCITVYRMLYNTLPSNIIVFADVGITIDTLRKQMNCYCNRNRKIVINWPAIKDWSDCDPIIQSITIENERGRM